MLNLSLAPIGKTVLRGAFWRASAALGVGLCMAFAVGAQPGASAAEAMRFAPPPSAHLTFDVKGKASGFSYGATAQLEWENKGHAYRAFQSVRVPLMGSRSQLSEGQVGPSGLHPVRFEDSRRNRVLQFDPAAHTVIYNGETAAKPIPANAQDRLSVFFQLASAVRADPARFQPGERIMIPTVSLNKQDVWTFEVEGTDRVDVPAGALTALKLRRLPRKAHDQTAEIWLAPDNQYLPARILVAEDDGDVVDLRLKDYEPK